MKRSDILAGLTIFLLVTALMILPVYADMTKVQPAVPENVPDNTAVKGSESPDQPPSAAQTEDDNSAASAETPAVIDVPAPAEAAANKDISGIQVPAGNQEAAAPANGKQKAVLNDDSYASNETALKAIGKSLVLFKDTIRKKFTVYLERSARYIEKMKEILKEKNIPEELVFLPIVESGFNPDAYSSARAAGPWQFIASTGKRYGLVIDWWRDERKDPVKSTAAAAEYLKDLYKMFGSWNLALAAYNAGEGKISKALRRSDSNDYWSLLNTKQIRNETKEYVPHYIAAAMIAQTPEEYGFKDLVYRAPLEYDEVSVDSPVDIEIIAKCAGCTVREIREMNPELRRWSTPPNVGDYTIKIPVGSRDDFMKNLALIPVDERFTIDRYTLKKGDSLKKIARKRGIPYSTIAAMNSLSGMEHLKAGNRISLPPQGKFYLDSDDRASLVHKVSYGKKLSPRHSAKKYGRSRTGRHSRTKSKGRVRTKRA